MQFTTVLAPGANVYHYNHIHVDLMRRASRPPHLRAGRGAGRGRRRTRAGRATPPNTAIRASPARSRPSRTGRALGYSGEDDDNLPLAVPGED